MYVMVTITSEKLIEINNKIDRHVILFIEDNDLLIKKEETNDIIQHLMPKLDHVDISKEYCKIDVTTENSGSKRGDVWISLKSNEVKTFEKYIICLIEAKHKKSVIGDMDWRDAMSQGKTKAERQNLNYYVVTNCKSEFRFYNSYSDDEIELDGKIITKLMSMEILKKIQTQVNKDNSVVYHKSSKEIIPVSQTKFRQTLKNLANIYRSAGLKKGDQRIDPTISFVVLKYISEKESEKRTLDNAIKLWDSLNDIANGKENGDLKVEFESMIRTIWDKKSQYKDNDYKDFSDLVSMSTRLTNQHVKNIYGELNIYQFHGVNFDLFGAIYEEFASQTKKKEFGEFYTRRHITRSIAKLLLRNELTPNNDLKICDPACGSGGFLTECFMTLFRNYSIRGNLSDNTKIKLKKEIFYGYDNNEKSVARTKLNMFLVGDGHVHIYENDSLMDWDTKNNFNEEQFDYIITNPPMGKYDGDSTLNNFDFTNEKRYELLFLERVIKLVRKGGEIAIIVNDGMLETPSREEFRKKILKNCTIHAIISLTRFAFAPYTKEKTYVMFMQKKQKGDEEIQKTPIWHFILDYDGYANSDKRYITKYHDDLPELEDKFDNAVNLTLQLPKNDNYKNNFSNFERTVNKQEMSEGLIGYKCKFVAMENINENNFYNLLSEFHLRPYKTKKISKIKLDNKLQVIKLNLTQLLEEI